MCRQHIGQVVSTCGSRQFATWFLPVCLIVCLCNLCPYDIVVMHTLPGRDRYANFRVRLLHSCATGRTFCFTFQIVARIGRGAVCLRCLFALFGEVMSWIANGSRFLVVCFSLFAHKQTTLVIPPLFDGVTSNVEYAHCPLLRDPTEYVGIEERASQLETP